MPQLVLKPHVPNTALQIDKCDIWWVSVSGPIVPVIPVLGVALSCVPQSVCQQQQCHPITLGNDPTAGWPVLCPLVAGRLRERYTIQRASQ